MRWYMNGCFANSHMLLPVGVLIEFHCIHTYAHNYMDINMYLYLYICKCTCKYSNIFIFIYINISQYHITDTFVYKPVRFNFTYVFARAIAHTLNPLIYMHILTSIHVSNSRYVCG